ncbi:YaaL family protein [Virgibacillus halophilus]|uniref:YaaL family protein n=1 Tax=Tigheibacillus halophilus TaxID=361280 RepID=A0ABU5C662_9BACI|nr:YaaL family protein [Virgibacillus halophilus]
MAKKLKKQDVDNALLDAVFTVEAEWKQLRSIISQSIEPTMDGQNSVALAQAKYLYLLREARHRKISAIRYN